jgi:hypothetical protein
MINFRETRQATLSIEIFQNQTHTAFNDALFHECKKNHNVLKGFASKAVLLLFRFQLLSVKYSLRIQNLMRVDFYFEYFNIFFLYIFLILKFISNSVGEETSLALSLNFVVFC